jgi:hypothetical protein
LPFTGQSLPSAGLGYSPAITILASKSASSIHLIVFFNSERVPWFVISPAWMSTSPFGSLKEPLGVALWVSDTHTKRVLRITGGESAIAVDVDREEREGPGR